MGTFKDMRCFYCDNDSGEHSTDCPNNKNNKGKFYTRVTTGKRSNCCNSTVRVEGKTTMYYVCNKCNKACDCK